mgnify:CR=1 FL=1
MCSSDLTNATACNSYSWNGNTYTSSGSYSYLTLNAGGCDSTAYLNLTLGYTSSSSSTVSTCNPSYTWNNTVYTTSGVYTFVTTNATGCDSTATLNLSINTFSTVVNVFSESIGTVGGTTAIATHETNNAFDNDNFTMSGTADIRSTSISSGYTGASGGANVYFATNGTASFQIEGINTTGLTGLSLRFGQYKNSTTSNGSELVVETSTDGVNYSPLSMTAMPTGTGTAAWSIRSSSSSIPTSSNLRIRWRTTSASIQFRIDDIILTKLVTGPAVITASGPTDFCPGGSVVLNASNGATFLWNSTETTQSISVASTIINLHQLFMEIGANQIFWRGPCVIKILSISGLTITFASAPDAYL